MQQIYETSLSDAVKSMEQDDYTVKSLFSGAGGLDCGLAEAGLTVVESYEFEKRACDTLAATGMSNVYKCDISKLLLENQQKTFVITATFPCTHFSAAGLRDGDELYLEAHRIIRCLEPEVFVVENVPAMDRFEIVMEAFMKMPGYYVQKFILNASDCGAPQNRKRLIILGSKKEFAWDFTPVKDKKYLWDIIEYDVTTPLSQGAKNRLAGANPGQWPAFIYDPEEKDFGPTCVAHYGKDSGDQILRFMPMSSEGEILEVDSDGKKLEKDADGKILRSFTTTEYARLQGFPDGYPFQGGKSASLKQIGNAVSPAMAKVIGREILRYAAVNDPEADEYNYTHHTIIRKEVIA